MNILFVKMRISKLIKYLTNMCWSYQGTTEMNLLHVSIQASKNIVYKKNYKLNMMIIKVII
jgi:hypothetical protein